MKAVRKRVTKLLAGVLAASMTVLLVPAFSSPANAAVKYKRVSAKKYTVKLPAGSSWTQDTETLNMKDLMEEAGAEIPSTYASVIPNNIYTAVSTKGSSNSGTAVGFSGFKSKQTITLSDLKNQASGTADAETIAMINSLINQDESLSSLGKIKVKSYSAKTVKVKNYKTALKVAVNGTFSGSGYKVTAKPVVYITVKKNHVLSTFGANVKISENGKTIKIVSDSSANAMAKTALESVKIK